MGAGPSLDGRQQRLVRHKLLDRLLRAVFDPSGDGPGRDVACWIRPGAGWSPSPRRASQRGPTRCGDRLRENRSMRESDIASVVVRLGASPPREAHELVVANLWLLERFLQRIDPHIP